MALLLIFFFASIGFSFLCSILEAVILSVTPSYVNTAVAEKKAIGPLLEEYKNEIDRPLSAILTLNTIAHTVGAIGVGAQAGKIYGTSELDLGVLTLSYESLIAGLMTLAILILSEIIPKTIGANKWRSLTPFTVTTIRGLLVVLAPFVWLSEAITKNLKSAHTGSVFSRGDFAALAKAGLKSGALDKKESTVIHNLLQLETLRIKDIMTPRSVMFSAEESQDIATFYDDNKPIHFSRIPVYEGRSDHITGVVLKNELLSFMAEGKKKSNLESLKRDVLFVRDDDEISKVLDKFVSDRKHMAIVTDQYGSVVGLVSLEDVFETLLGLDIVDESDNVDNLQKHARDLWKKRAKSHGLVE